MKLTAKRFIFPAINEHSLHCKAEWRHQSQRLELSMKSAHFAGFDWPCPPAAYPMDGAARSTSNLAAPLHLIANGKENG
jgi:hypothetical protein